jgi:hypothetical protein
MVTGMETIRRKYLALGPAMDERMRRLWAAAESRELGRGGIALVAGATGLARNTIVTGLKELGSPRAGGEEAKPPGRIRRPGGGRKRLAETSPDLLGVLESLVEPLARGDPGSTLRWTCKSTRALASEMKRRGYNIGERTVAKCLSELRYSLQGNRKTMEGASHPDRNAQFELINSRSEKALKKGQPVISVDAKKKELVGEFKNPGRTWCPAGEPTPVNIHDFADPLLGKAIPYGVYDLGLNQGWVSVGIDHNTAEFACETIRRWWRRMGCKAYPGARELLIMADGGGSNASRSRLWKHSLQSFADETGMKISVCHFPPGTSKWNKIEHRMFSRITENWRGQPLSSLEVIVNLIAHTTTRTGLTIKAELDKNHYDTGVKISGQQMETLRLKPHAFHGDWNYALLPRKTR